MRAVKSNGAVSKARAGNLIAQSKCDEMRPIKHPMKSHRANSIITLAGAVGFIAIVIYLHFAQTGYSLVHQLMSELAMGRHGSFMLWAFISFALSVAGAIGILTSYKTHLVITLLLSLASMSLVGAGIFTLGTAATLHIGLVALAFILLVLSMYLIPRLVTAFQAPRAIAVCWGLGAGTALFVGLGQGPLPMGLAQRLAAACILLWLSWLAIFNLRQKNGRGA